MYMSFFWKAYTSVISCMLCVLELIRCETVAVMKSVIMYYLADMYVNNHGQRHGNSSQTYRNMKTITIADSHNHI